MPFRSLVVRLALTYALISGISLAAFLATSYLVLQSTLQRRLDESLLNEVQEYDSLLAAQDMDVLRDVLDREAASEGTDQVFFRILDTAGNEVLATDMSAWGDVGVDRPHLVAAREGKIVFETIRGPGRAYPVRVVYGRVGGDLILQLGESTGGDVELLHQFRIIAGLGSLALIVFSVLIGGLMARRALSGVRRVTRTVESISSGAWESRVPVSRRRDEIDELATTFNEMIGRVQVLIRELKEVSDDIAHDLRTPVARIRATAETALARAEGNADLQEMSGSILEECDRLLALINTMLEIAQTEAGAKEMAFEAVDLAAIAAEICEFFEPAAEDSGTNITFDRREALAVRGSPEKLRRALAHVIDNAVKYSDTGGGIRVTCAKKGGLAVVSVEDAGIGMAPEELERVFARFYRADPSRSESGNGLGLSLARAICRAHGGDVTASSVQGEGSRFEIALPLTSD